MTSENNKQENKELPKRKYDKLKAFLVGFAVTLLGGGTAATVKTVENEKAVKEWKKINEGADSLSVDVEKGHFYAMKKLDQKALIAATAKKEALTAKKQEIVDKATKDFVQAFKNLDANGIKKAIDDGANIDTQDSEGKTPLMRLLEQPESAKAYICTRLMIQHSDMNIRDKDGASAAEYAAAINSVKGEVLRKEIAQRKKETQTKEWKAGSEKMKIRRGEKEEVRPNIVAKEISQIENIQDVNDALTAVEWEIKDIKNASYEASVEKDNGFEVSQRQKTADIRNFYQKHVR